MQYGITKRQIGHQNFLEISREKFDEAKVAHESLGETLRIEEKFNKRNLAQHCRSTIAGATKGSKRL